MSATPSPVFWIATASPKSSKSHSGRCAGTESSHHSPPMTLNPQARTPLKARPIPPTVSSRDCPNSSPPLMTAMDTITNDRPDRDASGADWLEVVRKNVANLRFGSVQITVHEGRVTQVESVEKTRFVASRETRSEDSR